MRVYPKSGAALFCMTCLIPALACWAPGAEPAKAGGLVMSLVARCPRPLAPRSVQKLESLVSCGIPVVVAKQSAKPLAAVYPPFFRRSELGLNDVILQSLVIPFPMIVFHKLVNRPS